MNNKKLLLHLLQILNTHIDPFESGQESFVLMVKILDGYGTIANVALQRYLLNPGDGWFSWGKLMGYVRQTYADQNHISSAKEAWGSVLQAINVVGRNGSPQFKNPVLNEMLKENWSTFVNDYNQNSVVADRAKFYTDYDNAVQKYLDRKLWQPISNLKPD